MVGDISKTYGWPTSLLKIILVLDLTWIQHLAWPGTPAYIANL